MFGKFHFKFEPAAWSELVRQGMYLALLFKLIQWTPDQQMGVLMFVSALLSWVTRQMSTPTAANGNGNGRPGPTAVVGLLLFMMLSMPSCGGSTPPPNLTPSAQQAFKNHELQKALDFARDVAVDAEAAGALSTPTARKMVLWHKAAISLVHAQGTGWAEQLKDITRALTSVNSTFSSDEKNLLTPYLELVMKALGGLDNEPTVAARVEGDSGTGRTPEEEVCGLEPRRTRSHERGSDRGVSVRVRIVTREGRRVVGRAPAQCGLARGQLAA